ncbi:MAG: hypothetical protein LBI15_06170 [Dysgonamonadaceae bacterium]|jgi:hypothetical protein|nr:hypothetical protein [Dysgonamonadaceae bacterium]
MFTACEKESGLPQKNTGGFIDLGKGISYRPISGNAYAKEIERWNGEKYDKLPLLTRNSIFELPQRELTSDTEIDALPTLPQPENEKRPGTNNGNKFEQEQHEPIREIEKEPLPLDPQPVNVRWSEIRNENAPDAVAVLKERTGKPSVVYYILRGEVVDENTFNSEIGNGATFIIQVGLGIGNVIGN